MRRSYSHHGAEVIIQILWLYAAGVLHERRLQLPDFLRCLDADLFDLS